MALTLFQKIWQRNEVQAERVDHPAVLSVGLHLLHEITAPQAFAAIEAEGLSVRRPDRTLALVDHCAPSARLADGSFYFPDAAAKAQISALQVACQRHGVPCWSLDHQYQGIVHAVAPELGLSRPGHVIVCGDSHTSTHGAFGTIAFGIGSSEVAQVLASQCILQRMPRQMRIVLEGQLPPELSAKDLALYLLQELGAQLGKGFAIEYQGPVIRALSMEQRMTLCNMTIEGGARFGLIAPDVITWSYLAATKTGQSHPLTIDPDLHSDEGAHWDREIRLNVSGLKPMMSWGTDPSMSLAIGEELPQQRSPAEQSAWEYMGWEGYSGKGSRRIDKVFIGSCTNGRLSDLREAAEVLRQGPIAPHLQCLIVPASRQIQKAAEAEGLHEIFSAAGAIWGEPGCSLCNAMNGDVVPAGQLCVSTSNRNFEGRQGPLARTILVSPRSAAGFAQRGFL